jgi:DNA-binding MarR family transcriptional regulator
VQYWDFIFEEVLKLCMSKNDVGRPRKLTRDEVLEAFDEVDKPVATGKLLSEQVDESKTSVLRRLDELEEDGMVEKWSVGANAVVWWRVET